MGTLRQWHAWRAFTFACALAWLGSASNLPAQTFHRTNPPYLAVDSDQPFGPTSFVLSAGGLHDKWLGLERKLDDENVQLALCDVDRESCASPAALRFLAIVDRARTREGRARLGEINRAINLAIRPMSDLSQHGEMDVWSSPLVTFYHGAGDCEDYAIAKFVALRLAGIAAADLRIVIMRDAIGGGDHAVAAARLDGHWLVLDNRRMALGEASDIRNYRPLFVIDQSGIMKYAEPLLAQALPLATTAETLRSAEPGTILSTEETLTGAQAGVLPSP